MARNFRTRNYSVFGHFSCHDQVHKKSGPINPFHNFKDIYKFVNIEIWMNSVNGSVCSNFRFFLKTNKCLNFFNGCSPVTLLHVFRTPSRKNTSGRLFLWILKEKNELNVKSENKINFDNHVFSIHEIWN